jgi:3-oxoacyl-[acyl-carrier protein] reductase
MADRYSQLINTPVGQFLSKQVGLPAPVPLERWKPGRPVIEGPVLLGQAPGSKLGAPVQRVLEAIGAEVHTAPENGDGTFKALVFDATGIASSEELSAAWEFFHPTIRRVRSSGRVIVLGRTPTAARNPRTQVAQRALEGLTRSIGKEVKRGANANLVYVAPKAEGETESTLRFLLSPKSAYVSGQVIRVSPVKAGVEAASDWESPLAGKVALVTGASRGIGRAIAELVARDGAHVVALDVPGQAADLATVAAELGGSTIAADITGAGAPKQIADQLQAEHGGVDIVVHNAGVTRDKTLGRMTDKLWNMVIDINLSSQERINAELTERELLREGGRIVSVSSISGIAGNAGQTNYSTSKAGVIGLVDAWAPQLAKTGRTINAVAPGFIETQMTAAMPITLREAGRRMNSMSQGGLPIDVAETIAWLAQPGSGGVNGNVVRVCGQSLLGA